MLGVEVAVEFAQPIQYLLHILRRRHQVCNPEVVRAISLSKAAARNRHDSRLVNHFQAVQEIWSLTSFFRLSYELLRKV